MRKRAVLILRRRRRRHRRRRREILLCYFPLSQNVTCISSNSSEVTGCKSRGELILANSNVVQS
jgi:hypothetical protein